MKGGNKGFAFIPAHSPDDPTASILFNMVFVGHGPILSAYQHARDVMRLMPEVCQIERKDDFREVMGRLQVKCGGKVKASFRQTQTNEDL
jgi:hypothetical protein